MKKLLLILFAFTFFSLGCGNLKKLTGVSENHNPQQAPSEPENNSTDDKGSDQPSNNDRPDGGSSPDDGDSSNSGDSPSDGEEPQNNDPDQADDGGDKNQGDHDNLDLSNKPHIKHTKDLLKILESYISAFREAIKEKLKLIKTKVKKISHHDDESFALTQSVVDDNLTISGRFNFVEGSADIGCIEVSYKDYVASHKHILLVLGSEGVYGVDATQEPVPIKVSLDGEWHDVPQNEEGMVVKELMTNQLKRYESELCFQLATEASDIEDASGELIFQIVENP